MKKLLALGAFVASTAMADLFVFSLNAAFGQGVQGPTNPAAGFGSTGLKGPRATSMTVSGTPFFFTGGPATNPGEPPNAEGFNFVFHTGSRTSFTQVAGTNTWTYGLAGGTSFVISGRFAGIAYGPLFTGTVTSDTTLQQTGCGLVGCLNTINQVGFTSLSLWPTGAGVAFLQLFNPTHTHVINARMSNLSFNPNVGIGPSPGFNSTGALFLSGQISFTAVPEPATYMSFGLAALALGSLRLRRK